MDRKAFIKTCGFTCLGGLSVISLIQSCGSSNYYAKSTFKDKQLVLGKSEFIKEKDGKKTLRKYVLLKTEQLSYPICIYKTGEDQYSALLMECTHKSCELQPHGDYLVCPCHGSEFSNKGAVQNPPAEDNLKTFQVKTDHENIYILL
jgi:nitrite reductase/ring-hydroxylating ferredoxin subunit